MSQRLGNPAARIILLNAEKLISGRQAEAAASLGEGTELRLNASYIDATFDEFTQHENCYSSQTVIAAGTCGNVQDLSGARLPNTPKMERQSVQAGLRDPGAELARFRHTRLQLAQRCSM